MNHRVKTFSMTLLALTLVAVAATPAIAADRYPALEGVDGVRAVFDVRATTPQTGAVYLDLIHQSYRDAALGGSSGSPEFAVVFMGPGVKLVSDDVEPATPEEAEARDRIAARVAAMAADGIALEVCLFAGDLMGLDPDSFQPEISRIQNGWISSIGYQTSGYAMIPAF